MINSTDKIYWVSNLENLGSIHTETGTKYTPDSILNLHICHFQTEQGGSNQKYKTIAVGSSTLWINVNNKSCIHSNRNVPKRNLKSILS